MAAIGKLNRQMFPENVHNEPGAYVFDFSFETDGSNDPTNGRGRNVKITRTGTGEFAVQMPYIFTQLVSCVATMQDTAESDSYCEVDGYDTATGILTIRVMDAGTNGAVDEDGPRVNVHACFQLSPQLAKTWT